jgi:phosphocarrier protein
MSERTVAIASAQGLHARPASLFAQAAGAAGIPVTIAKAGGSPVDAASMLLVMTLAAGHGEQVVLTADGPDADDVLDSLVGLLATDLDADA